MIGPGFENLYRAAWILFRLFRLMVSTIDLYRTGTAMALRIADCVDGLDSSVDILVDVFHNPNGHHGACIIQGWYGWYCAIP